MAYQSVWYKTELPQEIIDILSEDIKKFDKNVEESTVGFNSTSQATNKLVRKSKNSWIPGKHWIQAFIWHYVQDANKGFDYDVREFEAGNIQYTHYETGDFYHWHTDSQIGQFLDYDRKLSIVVQLSDPEEYEGGCLELIDVQNKRYVAPKSKGTVIIFDSRTEHRVTKVRSGYRRSLVGWAVGPKWK